MGRWRKGEEQVTGLVEQRHLQQVAADSQTAAALLASAGRHVDSARRTVDTDPEAAYALAYDAARKSATALLAHQGLRPTTSGGRIAVVDDVVVTEGHVDLHLGPSPIRVPEPLAGHLRELVAARAGRGRHHLDPGPWLFPGRVPDRHIDHRTISW
jgi:hypothetical protein